MTTSFQRTINSKQKTESISTSALLLTAHCLLITEPTQGGA